MWLITDLQATAEARPGRTQSEATEIDRGRSEDNYKTDQTFDIERKDILVQSADRRRPPHYELVPQKRLRQTATVVRQFNFRMNMSLTPSLCIFSEESKVDQTIGQTVKNSRRLHTDS
jgi:hypothetical protein